MQKIEEAIHKLFTEHHLTLSLAESCTGGAVASRLTKLAGASQYFLGAVVSYADEVKIRVLGVEANALARFGAVSKQIAEQMALGVRQLTKSAYSLSITGIAGPAGALSEKPVGTVWIALAEPSDKVYTWQLHLKGNREEIIEASGEKALLHLFQTITRHGIQKS